MIVLQDVRYALRMMRRAPAFTGVAILSLALGIGANTAIFSLLDALILRRLPIREPGQLVEFLNKYPNDPALNVFSPASYEYFRDHNHVFSAITGDGMARLHVRGDGLEPQTVDVNPVLGNFFDFVGVNAAAGRLIGLADAAPGAPPVAVVSWGFWKSRFPTERSILGKRLVVEDVPVTIVGVGPRGFFGLQPMIRPDLWIPMPPQSRAPLRVTARLKPGVSLRQARAEMTVLFEWTLEERSRSSVDPLMRRLQFSVEPAASGLSNPVQTQFVKPLALLMAVVALLLLIACTNVASMLVAKGAARHREIAVRVALGAGRGRLLRQVLTESLILSGTASVAGLVVAYFGAGTLVRMMTSGRFIGPAPSIEIPVVPNGGVLLFTAAVAMLTGLLFGLAPAWNAFSAAPATEGRAGETRLGRLFGKSLVVAQVAISVVILSAAGLFVGHLSNLHHLDLGFRRDHILLVTLDPARSGYEGARLAQAYRQLLARFEAIPGVIASAISAPTPLSGAAASRFLNVEGFRERPEDRRYVLLKWVSPKYFETLGTPLLAGRDFSFQDQARARVAIVNQAWVRYYFPNGDAIGKHFAIDASSQSYEVIGVAGDTKYYDVTETSRRIAYLHAFQENRVPSDFALRTSVNPESVAPQARAAVREVLKTVSVARITTLTDQVDATIVPQRLMATLSGWFGVLGSLLAAVGLYGLLAYTVTRRTNEIGVRMALGATSGRVLQMILRDALSMIAAGLLVGTPVALWGKSLATAMMGELAGEGLATILFALAAMVAVGLLAAYIPALRASRVEPVEALRHE